MHCVCYGLAIPCEPKTGSGRTGSCFALIVPRTWLAQVISPDLNWAVSELLQQLLLWQERAKAANHLQGACFKRVVSGLRCAL